MNPTLKKQIEKTLALTFSDFKNEEETLNFLKSFLTDKELETLSKRLSVLYWLSKKRTQENIKNNLHVTSKFISENENLLNKKEVKEVVKKIDADAWATKWSSRLRELLKTKN
ncbi:MAG TPA: Trp family transcriptional regulator [Patescibacteria group bacterium]|nr:Trp family transcriptional regulator [Patescibacteria group bacterium]